MVCKMNKRKSKTKIPSKKLDDLDVIHMDMREARKDLIQFSYIGLEESSDHTGLQ